MALHPLRTLTIRLTKDAKGTETNLVERASNSMLERNGLMSSQIFWPTSTTASFCWFASVVQKNGSWGSPSWALVFNTRLDTSPFEVQTSNCVSLVIVENQRCELAASARKHSFHDTSPLIEKVTDFSCQKNSGTTLALCWANNTKPTALQPMETSDKLTLNQTRKSDDADKARKRILCLLKTTGSQKILTGWWRMGSKPRRGLPVTIGE